MATVTTSFSSAANLELAYTAMNGGWDVDSAVGWGVAAFDFMSSATRQAGATISTVSSSYVAGIFADGDRFSYSGTNLTGAPRTATQLDYIFVDRGVSVSLFGAVTRAYDYAPQTGYINKVIVSSPTYGNITLLGYDDITVAGPSSISNVSLNVNGAQVSASGSFSATTSIIGGYYQTTLSGSYNTVELTYAGQSFQLSNVSIPISSGFVTGDAFLASVLSGNDTINGSDGNNDLTGYAGNDVFNGGVGTDTVVYSGNYANYALTGTSNGYTVRDNIFNRDGTDTLTNIERLRFADKMIALDLAPTDNAGQAVLFIGVLAPDLVATPDIVGLILDFVDDGMSMQHLNQLAVDIGLVHDLAGGSRNADVAGMAFKNVVGVEATPDMIDLLVSYMDGRVASFTQSEFLTVVGNLEANQLNVDLVGLAQAGIEYAFG